MVQELCGEDTLKWQEAIDYSKKALEHRIALWNGVENEILLKQEVL